MSLFKFKQFDIYQESSAMKVGTDAMVLGSLIDSKGKRRGLDVGTGTGVLSLMVAQNNPEIRITGIDIDEASVTECRQNFAGSKWGDRMDSLLIEYSSYIPEDRFDLIFSNPPYYQTRLEGENKRIAQAKHESSLPMKAFVEKSSEILTESGDLWIIVPYSDMESWTSEFTRIGLNRVNRINIIGKSNQHPVRVIMNFSRSSQTESVSALTVRTEEGDYTVQYKELTKDFHYNKI
jgi:tRNA1Val (adenine37-N6)-methyltransferase